MQDEEEHYIYLLWVYIAGRYYLKMEQVQAYYQAFTGALGSYVYTRDNLLFQTSVSMPKETADRYQEVFMSFEAGE